MQTLINAVVILALIAWMGYRQLTWRAVAPSAMYRTPLVLGIIGVVMLSQQPSAGSISALDIAVLAVELVISLGIGAWMGSIAHLRALAEPVSVGRGGVARVESRTGALGIVLWVSVIVVRIGIDVLAGIAGSHLASATGVIFLVLAANRAARVMMLARRIGAIRTVEA